MTVDYETTLNIPMDRMTYETFFSGLLQHRILQFISIYDEDFQQVKVTTYYKHPMRIEQTPYVFIISFFNRYGRPDFIIIDKKTGESRESFYLVPDMADLLTDLERTEVLELRERE